MKFEMPLRIQLTHVAHERGWKLAGETATRDIWEREGHQIVINWSDFGDLFRVRLELLFPDRADTESLFT